MPTYTVQWLIDIDADSPEEAAMEALRIQRDPDGTATLFDVWQDEYLELDNFDAEAGQ